MAVTYLRLFDPTQQFQLKNGAINVAGLLKVKLEGTDDYAPVYDEDGTQLQQPVILDNNGRSKGLFVDSAKVYWLEVDDRDGYELFTIRKMTPCGGGGGSMLGGKYEVISSDGTVSVERYDDGGIIYFDLSTALTSQAATWGATFATVNAVSGDDNWEMLPVVTSAGTSHWNNGWTASKDCVADIAASLEMDGDSAAISTIDVMCVFTVDGTGVSTEYSQLDPSDSRGKVSFEYKGELLEGQVVDCRIFVKSVESMSPALVAKAYFNEECDGIIGGGSEGGDYHAGDYVEITEDRVINVTGLQPVSGMTSYVQQSSFSSISSVVSSIQNDTGYISSVVSGITGGFTGYIPYSALSGDGTKITGISGSAIGGTDYSAGEYIDISGNTISVTGLQPVSGMSSYVEKSAFDDCCSAMSGYISSIQNDTGYISSVVSGLTGQTGDYVEKSAISAQSSIWNEASGMSGKLDNSASSNFYPMTGNPSGFLTEHQDLSGYVEKSAISAQSSIWNEASGMSGKLDNSASSLWYPMTGNPSGFLTEHQDLSGYVPVSAISAESSTWNSASAISAVIPWSALEGTGSTITAISGSAIGGSTSTGGKTYSGIDPVVVDNTADTISVKHSGLTVDETMTAYTTGTDIVIGVNTASFVPVSASSSFVPVSAISAASANWNDISSLSAYVAESAISAESSTWNDVSAKIPWSALETDGTSITAISGSALGGAGATGDYVEKSATTVSIGSANTTGTSDTFAQGTWCHADGNYSFSQGRLNKSLSASFTQGFGNSASNSSLAQGYHNSAFSASFAQGFENSASSRGFVQGESSRATGNSLAQGYRTTAQDCSFAQGNSSHAYASSFTQGYYSYASGASVAVGIQVQAKGTSVAFGQCNKTSADVGLVIGDGTASSKRHDLFVLAKDGEITTYSATSDTVGFAFRSAIQGKQDSSAMSAYQLSGDYAYNSSLSGYIPTSESSNYQQVTAMSAYQPSGDYIYASSLGTGTI